MSKRKLPPGMVMRGEVYHADFCTGGRRVRKKLSPNFKAACQILNDVRARADKGDFGIIDNAYDWGELTAEYLTWARQQLRPRVAETYAADLRVFAAYAPSLADVRNLTHKLIVGFRQKRLDEGASPRTVNRQVGTVLAMLRKAVDWGLIGENPIGRIKPLPNDEPRKQRRSLSLAEIEAILEASPDDLKPVWRMLCVTGIRSGELANLRFADVDFERRCITIRATAKGHKSRELPLDDAMLATIAEIKANVADRKPVARRTPGHTRRREVSYEHVFVNAANRPWTDTLLLRFYGICRRVGIEGAHRGGSVDLHSLRVSFTTLAIEAGANPRAVQAILGHATLNMTMGIYAKATERAKREAINLLPFAQTSAPSHVLPLEQNRVTNPSQSAMTPRNDKTHKDLCG